MRHVLFVLVFFLSICAESFAQDAGPMRFIRREIPWGQPVPLQVFGAPEIEVSIRSRQMSFVSVDIADYTKMVPVLINDTTINGPSRVVMQPTRETRRVEKKHGVPVPGGRSDMFLLYIEPTSGVQVYFSDEAGGQNRDVLVVGVPEETQQEPEAVKEEPASPSLKSERTPDGYLSDTLLDWYLRLEDKRQKLNLNDPEALRLFNEEAARYHAEVKRARSAANLR